MRSSRLRERHAVLCSSGQLIIMVGIPAVVRPLGVEGKMFHPMAFTVVIALLGAMILSVTFVPAALAMCIGRSVTEGESKIMERARSIYMRLLDRTFANRTVVLVLASAMVIGAGVLASRLGSEFVPSLNEGDFAIQALRIQAPVSVSQSRCSKSWR